MPTVSPPQSPSHPKSDDLLDLFNASTVAVSAPKDEMASIRAAITEALPQLSSNGFPHLLAEALQTLVWLVPFELSLASNGSPRSWATGFPSANGRDSRIGYVDRLLHVLMNSYSVMTRQITSSGLNFSVVIGQRLRIVVVYG